MTIERETFNVGLLLRRQFRRLLMSEGLDFSEDKGFLNSLFVVRAEPKIIQALRETVDDFNRDMERAK
jgi:hypothetical protein